MYQKIALSQAIYRFAINSLEPVTLDINLGLDLDRLSHLLLLLYDCDRLKIA
jgi:hypothetical protein